MSSTQKIYRQNRIYGANVSTPPQCESEKAVRYMTSPTNKYNLFKISPIVPPFYQLPLDRYKTKKSVNQEESRPQTNIQDDIRSMRYHIFPYTKLQFPLSDKTFQYTLLQEMKFEEV